VEELDHGVRLFFSSPVHRGRAAVRLVAIDPTITCAPVEVSDEDWAARSQAQLGAVRVGRLVVAPPWSAPENDKALKRVRPEDIVISIQPSMGFGTGHHPSTRLCLSLLQDLSVTDLEVLDVGTGSGVLAIAAARLGAGHVVAIDVDEDALIAARENIDRNDVGRLVVATRADAAQMAGAGPAAGFDVVLANLTGATLAGLSSTMSRLTGPRGVLIASGFTIDEADRVRGAFAAADLPVAEQRDEDGWSALALRHPA
jgi:ribosomal protein L11 methyltransferase